MNILYLSATDLNTTSSHRGYALTRLGHVLIKHNPYLAFNKPLNNYILSKVHFRTGYAFLQKTVCTWLNGIIKTPDKIDLIWIESGELFGSNALQELKKLGAPVVLFNHDDPTGKRDGKRFASLQAALPLYDLVTAVRDDTEQELKIICRGKVLRIWRSYDEVQHSAKSINQIIPNSYHSDVCFIGTWMRHENRDQFLVHLLVRGLNIAIWGDRWQKSAYWPQLKNHWRGSSLSGQDYVLAIQGAKICLGLLSKGNRDLHTTRSIEIPYAGGLLCAERTAEHLELYRENEEAVFWSDGQECAEKCLDLLAHPEKRKRIRLAGMKRVLENKVGNEDICQQIITAAFQ